MIELGTTGVIVLFIVSIWFLLIFCRWRKAKPTSDPLHTRRTDHVKLDVDLGDNVGVKSIRGFRAYMEDVYQVKRDLSGGRKKVTFYGVFDGHGGARASEFAWKHLAELVGQHPDLETDPKGALVSSFEELDDHWLDIAREQNMDDGSTAVVALVVDNLLYLANIGDCRAVISSSGTAIDLSHDHKPIRQDEKERIENLGGKIIFHGTWRVQGALAVTRAFGDKKYKKYVSATPEVTVRHLRDDDEFIVLASDGVWDVMSSQDAIDLVHDTVEGREGAPYHTRGADAITNAAYREGSLDNITTLVVDLSPHIPE